MGIAPPFGTRRTGFFLRNDGGKIRLFFVVATHIAPDVLRCVHIAVGELGAVRARTCENTYGL